MYKQIVICEILGYQSGVIEDPFIFEWEAV